MDKVALSRGAGIGAGIVLVGGFTAAFTSNMIILIIVPTIISILCSISKMQISFIGYCIGFSITAVVFALILDTVSPGFVDYLIYFIVIFGFTFTPILYSRRNQVTNGSASTGQPMQVSPSNVSGVPGPATGQPKTRLEELDKQSSLVYLCPYCNAEVQLADAKCPACGAELDHRITKVN